MCNGTKYAAITEMESLIHVTALQCKAGFSPNNYDIATYKMPYYLIQICASVF